MSAHLIYESQDICYFQFVVHESVRCSRFASFKLLRHYYYDVL